MFKRGHISGSFAIVLFEDAAQFRHGARARSRRISNARPRSALAIGQTRSSHARSVIERMRRFTRSQGRRKGSRDPLTFITPVTAVAESVP